MRSLGNLLDAGLAEATPKRDSPTWIRQKAAEVAKKNEAENLVKKLLASGMSADEILEKLK